MPVNGKFISIRMDIPTKKRVHSFAHRLGRKTAHVTREAIEIGIGVMEMPEYFTARVSGKSVEEIQKACRRALKDLNDGKGDCRE